MRSVLLGLISLVLGFSLGWFLRPKTSAPEAPGTTGPGDVPSHLEAVRWLKKAGFVLNIQPMTEDRLAPQVIRLMNLTPAEATALAAMSRDTRQEIDAARLAGATSHISDDGRILVVDVPAIAAAASSALHDRYIGSLKVTLGHERFALLNELMVEGFEQAYGRFGLDAVRYEINRTPVVHVPDEPPYVEYKFYRFDAHGDSHGWSSRRVNFPQIEDSDPILAAFFPRELRSPALR